MWAETLTLSQRRGGKEVELYMKQGKGEGDMAVRVCAPKGPRITHMSAKC